MVTKGFVNVMVAGHMLYFSSWLKIRGATFDVVGIAHMLDAEAFHFCAGKLDTVLAELPRQCWYAELHALRWLAPIKSLPFHQVCRNLLDAAIPLELAIICENKVPTAPHAVHLAEKKALLNGLKVGPRWSCGVWRVLKFLPTVKKHCAIGDTVTVRQLLNMNNLAIDPRRLLALATQIMFCIVPVNPRELPIDLQVMIVDLNMLVLIICCE